MLVAAASPIQCKQNAVECVSVALYPRRPFAPSQPISSSSSSMYCVYFRIFPCYRASQMGYTQALVLTQYTFAHSHTHTCMWLCHTIPHIHIIHIRSVCGKYYYTTPFFHPSIYDENGITSGRSICARVCVRLCMRISSYKILYHCVCASIGKRRPPLKFLFVPPSPQLQSAAFNVAALH